MGEIGRELRYWQRLEGIGPTDWMGDEPPWKHGAMPRESVMLVL